MREPLSVDSGGSGGREGSSFGEVWSLKVRRRVQRRSHLVLRDKNSFLSDVWVLLVVVVSWSRSGVKAGRAPALN
jgi:hypothetical protein